MCFFDQTGEGDPSNIPPILTKINKKKKKFVTTEKILASHWERNSPCCGNITPLEKHQRICVYHLG